MSAPSDGRLTVLVIAKEPVAGAVKTRLTPPFTPAQAARLAEAALTDTLELVSTLRVTRQIVVLSGSPGAWLPDGFEVLPQTTGGLDARIAHAFAQCAGPTLLLGMDTPQLRPEHLTPVLTDTAWQEVDAWYGPATDGGFWALGLATPRPDLVRGVPMSRRDTGALQRRRLVEAGLRVGDLPPLTDVDTATDAAQVAAACHGTFAEAYEAALSELTELNATSRHVSRAEPAAATPPVSPPVGGPGTEPTDVR